MSAIHIGTLELIRNRRSIRTYTEQSVDRDVIELIVDAARMAPTAMNNQPWEFVILTERELLKGIPPVLGHAEFIANAAFCVLVLGSRIDYAVEDCCAATENLILAAEAFGLGSCWVAGTGQAYSATLCKTFGVPENLQLINIVAVGYPAESPTIEKRLLKEMIHWNHY
jgi:nitroreductase